MKKTLNGKYTVIDLFAGCGGFSQGFLKAGFEVVAANEIWEPAIETYKFNHENVKFIEGDITLKETKGSLYEAIKGKKINVIIGGPPCQGYSVAGNRNPDDPRGQLYGDYIEIVDHIKPDFFVMENVKGLRNMRHVRTGLNEEQFNIFKLNCQQLQRYKDLKRYSAQRDLTEAENKEFKETEPKLSHLEANINSNLMPLMDKILNGFKDIKYKVQWKLLNSVDYGVAQKRERIIFMGTKHKNAKIVYPKITHVENPNISLEKFIYHQENSSLKRWNTAESVLKKYEKWEENYDLNHVFTRHTDHFTKRIENTKPGENAFKTYTDSWWRLERDKPAKTVKENHGGVFIHYDQHRVCTPRELAALQSFDDDFLFKGTKSAILKQIGNAVPPLMAKAIAEQIKILLNEIQ